MRGSLGGGEGLGLRGSSLDGGLGLTAFTPFTPFTYEVVGRVTVEKAVLVDSGEQTLVSDDISEKRLIQEERKRKSKSHKKKVQACALLKICSFNVQQ